MSIVFQNVQNVQGPFLAVRTYDAKNSDKNSTRSNNYQHKAAYLLFIRRLQIQKFGMFSSYPRLMQQQHLSMMAKMKIINN